MEMQSKLMKMNLRTYSFSPKTKLYLVTLFIYILTYMVGYPGLYIIRLQKALSQCLLIVGLMCYGENVVLGNAAICLFGLSQYMAFGLEIGEVIMMLGIAGIMVAVIRSQILRKDGLKPIKLDGIGEAIVVLMIISTIATVYSGIMTGKLEVSDSLKLSRATVLGLAAINCMVYLVYIAAMANLANFYFLCYVNCAIDAVVIVNLSISEPRGIYTAQMIERAIQIVVISVQVHEMIKMKESPLV